MRIAIERDRYRECWGGRVLEKHIFVNINWKFCDETFIANENKINKQTKKSNNTSDENFVMSKETN